MSNFKKVDIFYKDSKGNTHYIHSTESYKTVRLAVDGAKFLFSSNYAALNAHSKKIGEQIITSRIFGRRSK